MGLEENGDEKVFSRHQRSKSFPDKRRVENGLDNSIEESPRSRLDMGRLKGFMRANSNKKQQSPRVETHNSLKHEILQLEKRLQEQFGLRRALEKALGSGSGSSSFRANEPSSVPKPATELIKDIAVLELEVGYLEQYLLTLYRKAFDQQISSVSPITKDKPENSSPHSKNHQKRLKTPSKTPSLVPRRLFVDEVKSETAIKFETSASQRRYPTSLLTAHNEPGAHLAESNALDNSVFRCHSALSHRTMVTNRPAPDSMSEALRACQSQPLSMSEFVASNAISLAEHLGTRLSDQTPETPNRISEEMVKCMGAIFCKLGEPPSTNNVLSSPNSSSSSTGAFSPHNQCDVWSSSFGKDSSFDTRLDNPFNVEGLKEFSGPYSTMFEVSCIYREAPKLAEVEYMLQSFKSLINRLQEVDVKKMNHEEKLAFWINIHNALVMHAYLAYGIPQNNVKRVYLLLKAAYNVGGHTISADTIQSSILGCRMSRPGQWLRMLLSPRSKFKTGDNRQAYAIEHPEPLLHFALCSGSHSDPALRVYSPKRVLLELEGAKEEYIRAAFGMRKDQKVILPKVVESYGKDSGLCPAGIYEMIQQSLPDSLRKGLKRRQSSKSRKNIEWMPHNFTFRYLISKDLIK